MSKQKFAFVRSTNQSVPKKTIIQVPKESIIMTSRIRKCKKKLCELMLKDGLKQSLFGQSLIFNVTEDNRISFNEI